MANRLLTEPHEIVAGTLGAAPLDEGHLLETFLRNSPDHVYFKDLEGRFTHLSRSLATWMGVECEGDALGYTDFDFFADEHASAARKSELEIMRTRRPVVALEEREVWPDGRVTWVSTTKVPLCDGEGRVVGIFGASRDITARKELEERESRQADELATLAAELERLTLHDALTGLYNRRGLEQLGNAAIRRGRTSGAGVCVLFTDLDGLKAINDRFGHASGDQALIDVAQMLREAVRSSDVVGRIGGDEFAAVLVGLSDTAVDELCDRVRLATLECRASGLPLSVSIGVARATGSESLDEMLAIADRAMYDQRHRRRRSYGN
jgi:diguanylate cyclase (GGDEF)-like protein/PAS domain S-box-containing protein